ncbi:ribonuclease III [Arenibaculum pallidiluteum]|uniref:ribonuclease III n=1 Tax=Arenibaculum pallidiluteum TaxID=2812559 RepID=UPI001A9747FF|nr:ribonuclease III [Arenibaculum pallidiluteum]
MSDLDALAERLGHSFSRPALLADAVTHPSLAGNRKGRSAGGDGTAYERLEFLGDRVLGLVVAAWLLERHPSEREGDLAKRHAALVRREALGAVARGLELGSFMRLSAGEEEQGGRDNGAILADCCEAVIGALFLDGGLPAAEAMIRHRWAPLMDDDGHGAPPQDPKTALQEWAQGRGKPLPLYETIGQSGPDHDPRFEVRVVVDGLEPATARAGSKRAAEKAAATALLRRIRTQNDA